MTTFHTLLHKISEHHPALVKHSLDATATGIVAAAWVEWLTPIATALSIIWFGLQIYGWFERRKKKRDKD